MTCHGSWKQIMIVGPEALGGADDLIIVTSSPSHVIRESLALLTEN